MIINVSVGRQTLTLYDDSGESRFEYSVSTAKNGTGQLRNSECTPVGRHLIRAKIGAGCSENTVFVGRRPTGEIYSRGMRSQYPNRDWILTRILWLSGKEPGKNRLGDVDTMSRYVYIHGAPDDDEMGASRIQRLCQDAQRRHCRTLRSGTGWYHCRNSSLVYVTITRSLPPGPLMLDIEGTELTKVNTDQLLHPLVGGVILFARNYHSPEQLDDLATAVHQLRSPALLISVDQEGGRVQRFRDGFQRLPPVSLLGDLYSNEPEQAVQTAESFGWLMASELRALDVDFSFAPVLDVPTVSSHVIGGRAFYHSPEGVVDLAGAYIKGMHRAGMASVGKHFPGHGGVSGDSHLMLPTDTRKLTELRESDLMPYQALIPGELDGIMTAHVVFSAEDNEPPTYSNFWLQQVLRDDLGFDGVIFSDDLSMEGAKKHGMIVDRAQAALAAGCDMVLVCNDPDGVEELLEKFNYDQDQHPELVRRLDMMRPTQKVDRKTLHQSQSWQVALARLESLSANIA